MLITTGSAKGATGLAKPAQDRQTMIVFLAELDLLSVQEPVPVHLDPGIFKQTASSATQAASRASGLSPTSASLADQTQTSSSTASADAE